MSVLNVLLGGLSLLLLPLLGSHASEVQKVSNDKTLSPYFLVQGDDPAGDKLPLETTEVTVDIAGVIADVRVTQVYKNAGAKPIEAIYVFPASTRAAVYGLKMTLGERTIVAQIKEKGQARADYEQAKQRGQTASLLEQERPNVFQMNVANILPGDVIKVELRYTELLVPTDGQYEFMYPTVVGPRYAGQQASTAQNWVQNPYLGEGVPPQSTLKLQVNLATGVPLQAAACATHKVDIAYDGPSAARITLAASEQHAGNRDFILQYRLSGAAIETGVLLYQGEAAPSLAQENFFLAMVQPPQRVTPEVIPARDYIFVVDVSGSMHGFPIETAKKLLRELIQNLRPSDTFNILTFSYGSSVLANTSLPATAQNLAQALRVLDQQQGSGGTELLPALKRALALPRPEGLARTAVVVTDGYVTVEPEVFDLIREHLHELNVFAFGIGSSVNRHLIEGMAHVGQGEPFILTQPADAPAQAAQFRAYIQQPVLTGIKTQVTGFEAYAIEPPSIPDVFAQRPVLIYGKWRGEPGGNITLRGQSGAGPWTTTLKLDGVKPQPGGAGKTMTAALRYLWARERLRLLADYNALETNPKRVQEMTDLALKYSLLSPYTSFVAIDSEVRRKAGEGLGQRQDYETVVQPLPLPEGVSERAVASLSYPASAPMPAPRLFAQQPASAEDTGSMPAVAPPASSPQRAEARKAEEARPEPKRKPQESPRQLEVQGGAGLDTATLRQVILTHKAALERCLPTPQAAEVVLEFALTHLGKVIQLRIISGSLGTAAADACLLAEVQRWQFPPQAAPQPLPVTMTLRFDAGGKLLP